MCFLNLTSESHFPLFFLIFFVFFFLERRLFFPLPIVFRTGATLDHDLSSLPGLLSAIPPAVCLLDFPFLAVPSPLSENANSFFLVFSYRGPFFFCSSLPYLSPFFALPYFSPVIRNYHGCLRGGGGGVFPP